VSAPRPAGGLLAAALAYAARGWAVFPLAPGLKRPAVADWERWATCDPDRLTAYWSSRPSAGVGIACGPSRLVVLDLDVPKTGPASTRTGAHRFLDLCERAGQPVPLTWVARTGRGGWHLYFTAPAGVELRNTAGRLGALIDTRAHGGYVVAPPTVVEGRPYRVDRDRAPVPLPEWLATALRPTPVPESQPVSVPLRGAQDRFRAAPSTRQERRARAYVEAAVRRERERVAGAPPGGRNHALFVASAALGQLAAGGALSDDEVYAALLDASAGHVAARAFTAHQARLTIRSGLRVGARRPRSIAA